MTDERIIRGISHVINEDLDSICAWAYLIGYLRADVPDDLIAAMEAALKHFRRKEHEEMLQRVRGVSI